MRKFYSRILAVCMAGTMAFTPFTPVGTLIGTNITIEAKAADAVDTSWYDKRTEGQTEFTISTEAQLRGLAQIVNSSDAAVEGFVMPFTGCTVKLANDIVMDADTPFAPIGVSRGLGFAGVFDGQGHTIKNLTVSKSYDKIPTGIFAGLFGSVLGNKGSVAEIKNVTLENATVIESTEAASSSQKNAVKQGTAALVGYGKNIVVENCNVKNSYVENNVLGITGGLIGHALGADISNCKVTDTEVKGISNEGLLGGKISLGTTDSKDGVTSKNKVTNIYVQGKVTGETGSTYTGGLFGSDMSTAEATDSSNIVIGKDTVIKGDISTAGVVGKTWSGLTNCVSYANVEGSGDFTNGIAQTGGKSVFYSNCMNYGDVNGADYVAGITSTKSKPSRATEIKVENCYNLGNISSTKETVNIGAISYMTEKLFTVANSYNLGTVKDLSGDKAQFNANDTYTNVAYNSENGIAAAEGTTGITGYTAAQFKDRTVVDALNANDGVEETVWYQNTENPDLAFNMTVTSDITVPETLNVTLGKTMKLQASITPEDATNKTLVYTSSDDTIASVKEDGTVSGLKLGTADITVKAMDTGKEKTVKVTVKKVEKEPANPAKPSQPTTKTVKKGTKLIVGTNTFVVTNVKAKTVSYKATKNKKAAKITIPATVKSGKQVYKVTTIADNAFKNNKKIKTVVVGKNVRTIGKKAFYGCKNLKKITVQSSIIKKVGAKAFKGINKKAVIKVPSKKYKAYKKVFKGKGQAKTVTIKK